MEVIILAGGLGTRLRSEVKDMPKCMAPVAGKPFLWYLLKYLARFDVSRVILSVGYLREVIIQWINEVKNVFPFEFDYAVEEEPLGTGGGIRLAMKKALDSEVVILNGDTYFEVMLDNLVKIHRTSLHDISVALKEMVKFDRYGSVKVDEMSGNIISFNEKKFCEEGMINGGVYVVNRESDIFNGLPSKFSFEKDVLEFQCARHNITGIRVDGYFIDIGVPDDYHKADKEFPQLFRWAYEIQ